jgi:Predicted glycosyltransferases
MGDITIQIQSVLYNNNLSDLERSIASLVRAYELYKYDHPDTIPFILKYGDASNIRIISDGDLKNLREKYKFHLTIEYEFFSCNTGTAKGHNILAKDCTSKYMMIMNPDVIVCPRFFFEILKPYNISELNAGLVEARQVPIEHPKDYNTKTGETSWATTACVVFTTEIFNWLNGFDAASFFMYCDDLDFSWRIRLLGKKIIYQPLALVFHAKRLTAKATWPPTSAEIYYSAIAAMMMARKWSNPKLMNKLVSAFSASRDETYQNAAKEFLQLTSEHKLPEPIDPEHKVATFVGDYYTKHRFVL